MKSFSSLQEDLRKWFSKTDQAGDWKRINSKGEAIGPCAREPGEPKPKCMSKEKRASLSKKERASAVRAKRKHDPNPERKGEPINVSNFGKGKISEDMENLEEKNVPTSPEKWAQAKAQAKAKFDVYPSAYANGWAAKKYKEMGGGWKSVSEEIVDEACWTGYQEKGMKKKGDKMVPNCVPVKEAKEKTEYDYEGDMARGQLQSIINNSQRVHDMLKDNDNLPEWVQSKITLAEDYISTVANYMMSEIDEEIVQEGRPSQRHPLEGHEYHKKSDEALIHIAKDAHKAAEAMKSHNTDAENKYRDQANDSATVRHFRKTSGMPEWYKKKYGHINEQMANAPFDPPYSKKTGTHIDKSGAKHGPMSIARDLARTAVAKQAKSINKTDPTRKASIVREAMKDAAIKDEKKKDDKKVTSGGKDKFQPDPEISTQIIRQE